MARVRLLQLHQEQQQHEPITTGQLSGATTITTSSTTAATNQWLDLVPSNPILPQIALPGTPSSVVTSSHHHHHHHQMSHHQDENGGGGSSSTESAHQARSGSGGRHSQPSKIPVVKSSYPVPRPPSSYRDQLHNQTPRDPYPSWNKCKSDQSLPRNWDPINHKAVNGGGSSIGSGGKQRSASKLQDSLQDGHAVKQHHRARRDSGSGGGGASLTRAKSQNHHQRTTAVAHSAVKDRTGTTTAVTTSPHTPVIDDTNKVRPTKRFANILNSWIRKS